MESTRVKAENCNNIYSLIQRKHVQHGTAETIKSPCYVRDSDMQHSNWANRHRNTRHPLQNPSQAPTGEEAQSEYHCLKTQSRSDISNTYSPKTLSEKAVWVLSMIPMSFGAN